MTLIHSPKQARSLDTQEKLLQALEEMLGERSFEQITIRDLAERAGVASGTVYRRFKDKEAMLPVLYERFDQRLADWLQSFWSCFDAASKPAVGSRIRHLVEMHFRFYSDQRPIMRTLYLQMRLYGEPSLHNIDEHRRLGYTKLLRPVIDAVVSELGREPSEDQIKVFLLLLLSSINEHTLFGESKPLRSVKTDTETFKSELTRALCAYLRAD
ncbi:MAG: hypothetical protein Cons2KO_10080 [Congregibacter sp.]